jgi:heat shock protein HtpX
MNGLESPSVVSHVMKNHPKNTASPFIVNPFAGMRGIVSLFSTHPPMHERVRRLRGMQFVRYAA